MKSLYTFWGKVRRNKGRGKLLGYPTANIALHRRIPEGIYASVVTWKHANYRAATFIGQAKTFNESDYKAECYLLDFNQDLYGEWGASTAVSKYVLRDVSFLTATALRFLIAPLFALIFILLANQSQSLSLITPSQWGNLLLITFTTGMVALTIYYYGLKKTPARIATLCELVWPASAIMIDFFLYQKTLTITQLLGVAVLLFAIYNVTKPLAAKKINPEKTL